MYRLQLYRSENLSLAQVRYLYNMIDSGIMEILLNNFWNSPPCDIDLSANKEKNGISIPRGTVLLPIPSKYISLKVRAVPLPTNVVDLLSSHTATIKSIVEQKIARRNAQKKNSVNVDTEEIKADNITGELGEEKILTASEFQEMLKEEFRKAQGQGGPLAPLWEGIVDQYVPFEHV